MTLESFRILELLNQLWLLYKIIEQEFLLLLAHFCHFILIKVVQNICFVLKIHWDILANLRKNELDLRILPQIKLFPQKIELLKSSHFLHFLPQIITIKF